MKISIFSGDICDAPAEAVCTSTNPRLSLKMGTGASIRSRGGFAILRECEGIVRESIRHSGKQGLAAGTVHITIAGQLSARIVIHCVASDDAHHSSAAIVRACVTKALRAADTADCRTIAMPLFGTGHARLKLDQAVPAMAEALRDTRTSVGQVFIVVYDAGDVDAVVRLIRGVIPDGVVDVIRGPAAADERGGSWPSRWGGFDDL